MTNSQTREQEKYLPLSENVGENVVVKKKKKKSPMNSQGVRFYTAVLWK